LENFASSVGKELKVSIAWFNIFRITSSWRGMN
jgi:hypothetical protein